MLGKRVPQHRQPARFHITPCNEWHWLVERMNICVRNKLSWRNGLPLPPAPASGPAWLLPCKDDTAVEIAKHQDALRAMGWKLLTCEPHVVSRIGQKANLHAYAKELGLLQHLPQHYSSPSNAKYPCMLKAAVGEHGRDVFIVHSAAEVKELAKGGFEKGGVWLLQELASGRNEYATSLLVNNGEILDAITTSYEYDAEVYVWPHVDELQDKRHSHDRVPKAHLDVFKQFLSEVTTLPPPPLTHTHTAHTHTAHAHTAHAHTAHTHTAHTLRAQLSPGPPPPRARPRRPRVHSPRDAGAVASSVGPLASFPPCPRHLTRFAPRHLTRFALLSLVSQFSGICNFNYKVRPDGGLLIFEVNARVGADLACDVPRRRAAALFNKLDGLKAPATGK